jgi:hypothetical protein
MTSKKRGNQIRALVLVGALLSATPGLAQENRGEPSSDGWEPIKHLSFTDEEIEGGVFAPDGTRIESIVRVTHPSLIELREGFEAEIVKTMEDM